MLPELFLCFLKVGLFSVGGGMVAITLVSQEVVAARGWLTPAVFNDLIAIAESTPGPIAINVATFVGMQLGGIAGAIIATIAAVLPGCLIALTLGILYRRYRKLSIVQGMMDGLRPTIVASIFVGGLIVARNALFTAGQIALASVDWMSAVLFAVCFVLCRKTKINPVCIIVGGGILGGLIRLLLGL